MVGVWLVTVLYSLIKYILCIIATSLSYIYLTSLKRFLCIKYGPRIKPSHELGIIITGATSGIGLLLAKHFFRRGFTVFAGYYNDQEDGYGELLELGGNEQVDGETRNRLFLVRMDIRSIDSITKAGEQVDALMSKYRIKIHCLINNAGLSKVGPFEWTSRESIMDGLNTNLAGTLLVTREFLLKIIQARGRVVNVGSGLSRFHGSSISVYGSTKNAITHFSECLHDDISKYQAACYCVLPGNFFTTSNILYSRIKSLQDSKDLLTPIERSTYGKFVDDYMDRSYTVLKKKLDSTGAKPKHLEEVYGIKIPSSFVPKTSPSLHKRLIYSVLNKFDGGSGNLETSGLVDAFDDAVCLLQPPKRLYAGDPVYMHLSGPSMEWLPPILCSLLGPLVVEQVEQG